MTSKEIDGNLLSEAVKNRLPSLCPRLKNYEPIVPVQSAYLSSALKDRAKALGISVGLGEAIGLISNGKLLEGSADARSAQLVKALIDQKVDNSLALLLVKRYDEAISKALDNMLGPDPQKQGVP